VRIPWTNYLFREKEKFYDTDTGKRTGQFCNIDGFVKRTIELKDESKMV
jgi:hypothetical protein